MRKHYLCHSQLQFWGMERCASLRLLEGILELRISLTPQYGEESSSAQVGTSQCMLGITQRPAVALPYCGSRRLLRMTTGAEP